MLLTSSGGSAVDQAIAACGGDLRSTIGGLIVANNYLETEVCQGLVLAVYVEQHDICLWQLR
jgi:hypothetical protein